MKRSEDIIINAPMSFAGAAQRSFRLRRLRGGPPWLQVIELVFTTMLALMLMLAWWFVVACWYVAFSLLLVPYRLLRRGSRKRKQEALRHREMMAAMEKKTIDPKASLERR
jgi:uncharacterized membrane protein (UPF0182 family)